MVIVASLLLEATRQIVGAGRGLPPVIGAEYRFHFDSTVLEDLWFLVAQLLVAVFVITQVARWADDDTSGRLQLVVANTVSRTRVAFRRALGLTFWTFAIVVPAGLALVIEAPADGVAVSPGGVVAATLLLLPLATSFGAAGAILAAWVPRASAGLLAAIIVAAYYSLDAGAVLGWPSWTQNLSPFRLYGHPLTEGVDGAALAGMLAVTVVGFAASAFLMRRRDLGT
jgi:ABC-2 type transport system permease protein